MTITYRVFTRSSKRPALHLLEVCWTFAGSCKHPITEPHPMIRESSGVGEVKVSGCLGLGVDVANGVNRQKTCGDKEARLP